MKLPALACLVALGLIGPASLAAAAPANETDVQAPAVATGRAGPAMLRGSDRRRRSYAACNRASHQRALRGGRRRRFLIRCKLGYERPRNPQAVQPGAPSQPAVPAVRKP